MASTALVVNLTINVSPSDQSSVIGRSSSVPRTAARVSCGGSRYSKAPPRQLKMRMSAWCSSEDWGGMG